MGSAQNVVLATLLAISDFEDGHVLLADLLTNVNAQLLVLVCTEITLKDPRLNLQLTALFHATRRMLELPGPPITLGNLLVNTLLSGCRLWYLDEAFKPES